MKTSDLIIALVQSISVYGDLPIEVYQKDKSREIEFIAVKTKRYTCDSGEILEDYSKVHIYTEDFRPF